MLSRFDGKTVRVTDVDGEVFTGEAESFPSGYGLHEFGVEEESLLVDGAHIFLSQIASIEETGAPAKELAGRAFDSLVGKLLDQPYRVADILPERVPEDSGGQYFAVDRYNRGQERMAKLREAMADILLRLNCYFDMYVSFDAGETWRKDPEPESFVKELVSMEGGFFRALFPSREAMIEIDSCDTYFTFSGADPVINGLLEKLTAAQGYFLWEPETDA